MDGNSDLPGDLQHVGATQFRCFSITIQRLCAVSKLRLHKIQTLLVALQTILGSVSACRNAVCTSIAIAMESRSG